MELVFAIRDTLCSSLDAWLLCVSNWTLIHSYQVCQQLNVCSVVRSGKPITKLICSVHVLCACVLSQELFELSLVLDVLYTWYLPTM